MRDLIDAHLRHAEVHERLCVSGFVDDLSEGGAAVAELALQCARADVENLGDFLARTVPDAEILESCIYALINEGARIVDEGIAHRSSDVDLVYLNGYGFPAYRGGPMFYGDSVGLITVARALSRIAAVHGADAAFWTPAPLLARLAQEGRTFSEFRRSST